MALSKKSTTQLRDSIRDGSFPDSNELLTAEVNVDSIPTLLTTISEGRDDLCREIRDVSKGQADDVDGWIAQAKKVQDDITKCKLDARYIVEEHERVEAMRNIMRDAKEQVELLEAEVSFTKALGHEIEMIGEISQALDKAGDDLLNKNPTRSLESLHSTKVAISNISAGRTKALLTQLQESLCRTSRAQLRDMLDARWIVERTELAVQLEVVPDVSPVTGTEDKLRVLSTDEILSGQTRLNAISDATELLLRKLEALVLPLMSYKSSPYPSSATISGNKLQLTTSSDRPTANVMLDLTKTVSKFLNDHLPSPVRIDVSNLLLPKIVSWLISTWLDDAIPLGLTELQNIEPLRQQVSDLAALLSQFSWFGSSELNDWIGQIPRIWSTKRRLTSLDAIRTVFKTVGGSTRQVERVERQTLDKEEKELIEAQKEGDDWTANWDDEPTITDRDQPDTNDDEEASGWGFDDEDEPHVLGEKEVGKTQDEEDNGEAWDWGDETTDEVRKDKSPEKPRRINGTSDGSTQRQEMILTETYAITDIPDKILNVIKRDLSDFHVLSSSPADTYFKSAPPTAALQAIPNLVLAMYRATAPTYYSLTTKFSNINLYNDTLYLVAQLHDSSVAHPSLVPALDATSKFGRQVYTRELEIQRTILSDLLDGAQGFVSCTRFPYSQECGNAVSATTDRIRAIHTEWKDILGRSHLMQITGSLITMVMHKVIRDVEDMEDISEPESKQLVEYCQSISALDNLFLAAGPTHNAEHTLHDSASDVHDQETTNTMTTIPLYVPNYLRFQYLTQILESSLVDIKYLWTEGELSLEFSADEVVDLIKALFAESQHRRNAIGAIRGNRNSR